MRCQTVKAARAGAGGLSQFAVQANIQDHLRSMNKAARQTKGGEEAFLELHIPITAVTELEQTGPASPAPAHQLTLLDTPGAHQSITMVR